MKIRISLWNYRCEIDHQVIDVPDDREQTWLSHDIVEALDCWNNIAPGDTIKIEKVS